MGRVNDSIEQYGPSDAGPTAASRLEKVIWPGDEIRVPPLDLSLEVSKRRGFTDRVEKLKRYLAHQA